MSTNTLSRTARGALASACEDVRDADSGDGGAAFGRDDAVDDRVDGVCPALVALPGSTEQTAQVLRVAAAHSLAVVARGRGTKLSWGRPPSRVDVVVDLSRMDKVLEHAAGDLIVAVQAGAPLAQVQAVTSTGGQRLAVDETVPGSSIGGTLATATSGPSRVLTGTVRDLLIGVTVVRVDGVVAKAGGRVVKNVAGYDLGKLVTGSFGTLAVITEALFRLHPLPASRRFVTVPVNGPDEAHRLVQKVLHSQLVPSAIEIDCRAGQPATVGVLVEGITAGVQARTGATLALLGGHAVDSEDAPDGWSSYPWSPGDTALKLTFALSGLQQLLTEAGAASERAGIPLTLRGSAGAGVVYGAIPAGADIAGVATVVETLRTTCTSLGGALVVVDAPAEVKDAVDVWGPVPAIDLMRRVKDRFDPEHRLSPGRFVGGI